MLAKIKMLRVFRHIYRQQIFALHLQLSTETEAARILKNTENSALITL
jgi:hypothetical protein